MWDSKDSYGRLVNGKRQVRIEIGYVYDLVYFSAPEGLEASFGFEGSGELVTRGDDTYARVRKTWESWIGTYRNEVPGLAGWSINKHHAYEPPTNTI